MTTELNSMSTEDLLSLKSKLQAESDLKGTSQLGKKVLLNSLLEVGR